MFSDHSDRRKHPTPYHWHGQRGSTAVEALVVLIILSMLTYAALELGRAYVQRGCVQDL